MTNLTRKTRSAWNLELALCVFLVSSVAAFAELRTAASTNDEPSVREVRIEDLVRQLGALKFRDREEATNVLISIGTPAKSQIALGLRDSDLEIKTRCELIMSEIQHRERNELMARFLTEPVDPDLLPGWDRFVALAGDDEAAKGLYSMMLREEWMFVQDMITATADRVPATMRTVGHESSPPSVVPSVNQLLVNRCLMLQNSMRTHRSTIKEGTLCALLFTASLDGVELTQPGTLLGFCTRTECQRYFFSGSRRDILMKLLSKVILKPQGDETMAQRMYLAARYGIPEGVQLARKTVADQSVRTYVRQSAILLVARFGDQSDYPELEKLLSDDTVSIQARNVQIRDIALASLIHMHGEQPREYGFKNARREDMMVYSASTLGFPTDAERDAAFAKWKERER